MKEEESKQRKQLSEQLRTKIKRKPYTEDIDGRQFTYSLLEKKNKSFIFSNQRLLLLKGNTSIGYARSIPEETYLPFYEQKNIPALKQQLSLSDIQNVTAQNDLLVIEFQTSTNQPKWEFHCRNKARAEEWKRIIMDAVNSLILNSNNIPFQVTLKQPQNNYKKQQNANVTTIPNSQLATQPIANLNDVPASSSTNKANEPSLLQPMNLPYQSKGQANKIPFSLDVIPQQPRDKELDKAQVPANSFGLQQLPLTINSSPIMSSQQSPAELREEYMRKKKEQQNIKNSLVQGETVLKSAIVKTDVSDMNWDYQFLKGESEYLVIERFKDYMISLTIKVIDDIGLEERRRQYKPIVEDVKHIQYEVAGVSLEISLLQLNEMSSFHDRSTFVSGQSCKQTQQQFKNANYILQMTRNKGRFRVPLLMMVYYKGFSVLAKSLIHSTNDYSNLNSIQRDINQLQRDTRIARGLFEDEDNLRVLAADQKYYDKLSRSENKFKKFDLCFLTDIRHFLPNDLYGVSREAASSNKLRSEFLQDEEYEQKLFNGGNLAGALSRVKMSTQTVEAIKTLTEVARSIPQRAASLVMEIEGLDHTVTNSKQLSSLLHLTGLNIRYLGVVYDHAKEQWLRIIINSEILARAAKYFLRYDLQDSTINLNAESIEQAKQLQITQVIGWINRVVGVGPESESLWRQIVRQAQSSFKCTISRDNLNIGFLIQALQHHGGFRLRGVSLKEPFFKASSIFSREHFLQFIPSFKVYDLAFTDHYTLIAARLQQLTYESFEQLSSILNLERRVGLDSHYSLGDMHEELVLYLINWLSPQQAPFLYETPRDPLPSRIFYQTQLTAVKWELKAGRTLQAEKIRDEVIEHVGRWLGPCHPILSELYDIFGRYYLSFRDEQKRAVSYCKSALLNQQKLLGSQHIKLADGYYNLGNIYLHYAKKIDALVQYKRAAQILTANDGTHTDAYAEIMLKAGQLYLANNAINDALLAAKQTLALSQQLNNPPLFLSSAELVSRCFQVSNRWGEYAKFAVDIVPSIATFRDSCQQLQSILKIILLPTLHAVATRSRESCRQLLVILGEFQQTSPLLAYNYIRSKIDDRSFPSSFLQYLQNIEEVLREVDGSGLMTRWRGFQANVHRQGVQTRINRALQFLCILDALQWILSGYFLEGLFSEQ